jgi:hypothetical protein
MKVSNRLVMLHQMALMKTMSLDRLLVIIHKKRHFTFYQVGTPEALKASSLADTKGIIATALLEFQAHK